MEIAYYILTFGTVPLAIASIWFGIFRKGERTAFLLSAIVAGMYLLAAVPYWTLDDANPLGFVLVGVIAPSVWVALAASDYRDWKREAAKP